MLSRRARIPHCCPAAFPVVVQVIDRGEKVGTSSTAVSVVTFLEDCSVLDIQVHTASVHVGVAKSLGPCHFQLLHGKIHTGRYIVRWIIGPHARSR
jgi:hypothetical protein